MRLLSRFTVSVVCVAATVLPGSVAGAAGPTASHEKAAAAETAPPTSVYLGFVPEGRTTVATADVDVPGTYRVEYFVSYPQTRGLLLTSVDGARPIATVSPAQPGTFGVFVYTAPFTLTAGSHQFGLNPVRLPPNVGSTTANLVGPLG